MLDQTRFYQLCMRVIGGAIRELDDRDRAKAEEKDSGPKSTTFGGKGGRVKLNKTPIPRPQRKG